MKLNVNQIAEIITKQVLENLSVSVRKIIREEIQLHEQLKRTQPIMKPRSSGVSQMVQQNKKHVIQERVSQPQVRQVKKIDSGVPEVDSILNDVSLLDEEDNSLVEQIDYRYTPKNPPQQTSKSFSQAVQQRQQTRPQQNGQKKVIENQPDFWTETNEMIDLMEERSRELKSDTMIGSSLLAEHAGVNNMNKLYDVNEISKDKLPL